MSLYAEEEEFLRNSSKLKALLVISDYEHCDVGSQIDGLPSEPSLIFVNVSIEILMEESKLMVT